MIRFLLKESCFFQGTFVHFRGGRIQVRNFQAEPRNSPRHPKALAMIQPQIAPSFKKKHQLTFGDSPQKKSPHPPQFLKEIWNDLLKSSKKKIKKNVIHFRYVFFLRKSHVSCFPMATNTWITSKIPQLLPLTYRGPQGPNHPRVWRWCTSRRESNRSSDEERQLAGYSSSLYGCQPKNNEFLPPKWMVYNGKPY